MTLAIERAKINREPFAWADIKLDKCGARWGDPQSGCGAGAGNRLTYSEQFNNAAWIKVDSSITANAAVAPDGTMTADKLIPNTSSSGHRIFQIVTTAADDNNCNAIYLKADGYNNVHIFTYNSTDIHHAQIKFELDTGVIYDSFGYPDSIKVDKLSNGWYRLSVIGQGENTQTSNTFYIDVYSESWAYSWAANGTDGILIWGAHSWAGDRHVPYTKTTSAAIAQTSEKPCFNTYASCQSIANFNNSGVKFEKSLSQNAYVAPNASAQTLTDDGNDHSYWCKFKVNALPDPATIYDGFLFGRSGYHTGIYISRTTTEILGFIWYYDNTALVVYSGVHAEIGKEYECLLTVDEINNQAKLYVNGVQAASIATISKALKTYGTAVYFIAGASSYLADITMYHCRMYDRVIDSIDAWRSYKEGTPYSLGDAVMDYPINDGSGTTITDYGTIGGNDMTISNSATWVKGAPKIHRWCTKTANLPKGEDFIPCIKDYKFTPGKTKPGKSLGQRDSLELTLTDFPDHDRMTDPYWKYRSYDPESQGTYFGKLLARNPYYQSRDITFYDGFLSSSGFSEDDFQAHGFVVEEIGQPDANDNVRLLSKDLLKKTSYDRAICPIKTTGRLLSAITSGATSATLTPTGIGDQEYAASGSLAIDDEVVDFTRSGDTLTLTRAQEGTVAASHNADADVQQCKVWSAINVVDIIYDLLTNYAGIDSQYIDYAGAWTTEMNDYLSTYDFSAVLVAPEGVDKILNQLVTECGLLLAWDDKAQTVVLQSVRSTSSYTEFTDADFIEGTLKIKPESKDRISAIWYFYGVKNPFELGSPENYNSARIQVDVNAESNNEYGEARPEKIYARFVNSASIALEVSSRKLTRYRNNPELIEGELDLSNDVSITDNIGLNSRINQDLYGANKVKTFNVVAARNDILKSRTFLQGVLIPYAKYWVIAPNSTPNYLLATEADQDYYGFICDTTTEKMSNGDRPSLIQ